MLGKLLGAAVGAKVAERNEVGGIGGALLGAGAVAVIRRMSLPALLMAGAGAYAFSKLRERGRAAKKRKSFETPPAADPA